MTKFDTTPRVLIVDDEVRLTESLESLALAMGFVCQVAHSGYDAQEMLMAEEFDLIITDLLMPGVSGFDLIDFARGRGLWTPIVVLTGQEPSMPPSRPCGKGLTILWSSPSTPIDSGLS